MPHFRLETNIPPEQIPADFPAKLCEVVSKTLGKPLNVCCATVVGGVNMSWGGGSDPTAQATLMSIGALGVELNKKHSKALSEYIYQTIGVRPDRMIITFNDAASSDVGVNGTTCHEIFGK